MIVAARPFATSACTADFTSPESCGTETGVGSGVEAGAAAVDVSGELSTVPTDAVRVAVLGVELLGVDVLGVERAGRRCLRRRVAAVAWPSETLMRTESPDFSVPPAVGFCAST